MIPTPKPGRYDDRTILGATYPTDATSRYVNIDSRFRTSPNTQNPCDFTIKLPRTYKNIVTMRLASIEIPNTWYGFSKEHNNIYFRVNPSSAGWIDVSINPGNYADIDTLCWEITRNLSDRAGSVGGSNYTWFAGLQTQNVLIGGSLETYIDSRTLTQITCTNSSTGIGSVFSLDFNTICGAYCNPAVALRPFDNNLGYNLGFISSGIYSGNSSYVAEQIGDTIGPNYIFLYLDSYDAVESVSFEDSSTTAFAKIIVSVPANNIVYDDGTNMISKTIKFPQPQNITSFRVRLTDAYGVPLRGIPNFSFTIELVELLNNSLYTTYLSNIPSTNSNYRR